MLSISNRFRAASSFYFFLVYLFIYILSLLFFYENIWWKLEGIAYLAWLFHPLALLLLASLRWGIGKFTVFIVPFLLMSIAFYWSSIFLLNSFSTYEIAASTYYIGLAGITTPVLIYYLLDYFFPSPLARNFGPLRRRLYEFVSAHQQIVYLLTLLSILISILFTLLFFIKAGGIPLLADNPEQARVEAMKGAGLIHRLSYLPLQMAAILLGIILAFRNNIASAKKRIIFLASLMLFTVFLNMLTGPRASPLWALIYMYISYELFKHQNVRIRHGISIVVAILTLVAIMGGVRYSGLEEVNLADTVERFVNRIYMNPVNTDRIVRTFENQTLGGNSFWIDLAVLKPGFQPDLGTILKEKVGAEFDGGGITVPLPAEGYLNYGITGVWIYAVVFAFMLKLAEYLVYFVPNILLKSILLVITPLQLMGVVTMGISGIIVKTVIPSLVVASALYILLLTMLTIKALIQKRDSYGKPA